jgi:hypothetical protein
MFFACVHTLVCTYFHFQLIFILYKTV